MKKVLLLLSSVALLATANAQEEASSESTSSSSVFKQEAGDKTLEFNFASPFANTASPFGLANGPQGGEIRFRSFKSETFALRVGVNVRVTNTPIRTQSVQKRNDKNIVTEITETFADVTRTSTVNFTPGFEMHFDGTEKLSPFVGAVATIGYTKTVVIDREAVDSDKKALTNNNNFVAEDVSSFSEVMSQKTRTGSLNLGAMGVAGFDYYFTKKLYIGAEMNFGFVVNKPFSTKVSDDNDSDEGLFAGENPKTPAGKSRVVLAPAVTGSFRLGFAF